MRFVPLALAASLVSLPLSASSAPVETASAPAPAASSDKVLLVDFLELGRVDRSLPRDVALVDLVNLSGHVLDIVLGEGSATIAPRERIIARVKAGDPPVTVSARTPGVAAIEGSLHLDQGLHYELALAYGPPPKGPDASATPFPQPAAPSGPEIAPKPEGGAAPATPSSPRPRAKGGKVDIGRRPRG